MAKHYFPSVLDDFEKQLITTKQSVVSSNNTEVVTNVITKQQTNPEY